MGNLTQKEEEVTAVEGGSWEKEEVTVREGEAGKGVDPKEGSYNRRRGMLGRGETRKRETLGEGRSYTKGRRS